MAKTKAQNDPWSTLPEKTAVVLQPPADPRYQLIESGRYIESLGVQSEIVSVLYILLFQCGEGTSHKPGRAEYEFVLFFAVGNHHPFKQEQLEDYAALLWSQQ